MTEESAPQLSEQEVNVRHHVYRIMDRHLDAAFEELDHLHKRGINDSEVVKALRDGGYRSEADGYIEWAQCIDPDVDPTPQGEELVTDPGDSPSYVLRDKEGVTVHTPEGETKL